MNSTINSKATALTRRRYDRLARWYDLLQRNSEQRMAPWRAEAWKKVSGSKVLEHVLSHRKVLRFLMRILNPLVVRLAGANINRETIENLHKAGFTIWV